MDVYVHTHTYTYNLHSTKTQLYYTTHTHKCIHRHVHTHTHTHTHTSTNTQSINVPRVLRFLFNQRLRINSAQTPNILRLRNIRMCIACSCNMALVSIGTSLTIVTTTIILRLRNIRMCITCTLVPIGTSLTIVTTGRYVTHILDSKISAIAQFFGFCTVTAVLWL